MICAVEICRHGARAPTRLFPFNQQFWKPHRLGELTDIGVRQHFLLGTELRERYVLKNPFLSHTYTEKDIALVSSASTRTKYSALSQLLGLYPEFLSQLIGPVTNIKDASSRLTLDLLHQAELSLPPVPSHDALIKAYKKEYNAQMSQFENEMLCSGHYLTQEKLWQDTLFPKVTEALKFKVATITDAASISSAIDCEVSAGRDLPQGLSPELYQELRLVHGFKKFTVPFRHPAAVKMGFSSLLVDIIEVFQQAIRGDGVKFKLYSAHDTTLAGLLTLLGTSRKTIPAFASFLLIELNEKHEIRCKFNDEEIGKSFETCPFPTFQSLLRDFIVQEDKSR